MTDPEADARMRAHFDECAVEYDGCRVRHEGRWFVVVVAD